MTPAKKHVHRGILKPYPTYMFREKDPIVDIVRTVVQDSGKTYAEIERDSGVSATTLWAWFAGATKRPQFATIMAVLRACGHDLKIGKLEESAAPSKRTATIITLSEHRGRARRAA